MQLITEPAALAEIAAHFDRYAIRAAMDRCGITLRTWQRECLIKETAPNAADAGMVSAVMGAGKSIIIALLCAAWRGPVIVTTSTVKLVEQLGNEIRRVTGEPVGAYYTRGKSTHRVTVTCLPSVARLAEMLSHVPGLLWIADEAHRCERETVTQFVDVCRPARRIGFSATPYRAEGGLTIWAHESYRYSLDDGIRDGVLVPPRVVLWTRGLADSLGVPYTEGKADLNAAVLAWSRAQTGPGVISAADIEDAEEFAAECVGAGYMAQAVHSRMTPKAVRTAIERLRTGELSALVHCHMLSEGVDMPWLMWMALRKGRGSRVEFLQEFGRPLRAFPGKTEAVIFDPNEATLDHDLNGWLEIAGEESEEAERKASEPPEPCIDPLTGEPFEWEDMPVKQRREIMALGEMRAYLSTAVVALTASGLIDPFGAPASKWRINPASEKSLAFLEKFRKTAHKTTVERGYLEPSLSPEEARHMQAVARGVTQILRGSENRVVRAGIVSDVCTLARTLLWGFGRRDDSRDKYQVRADAFAALARYNVDPEPCLNEEAIAQAARSGPPARY